MISLACCRLSLVLLAAAAAAPWAAAGPRSACDAAAASTVLAAATDRSDARAVAFDARHLRWPAVPATGRFRLLQSRRGALVAAAGRPARGIDAALPLRVRAVPPPVAHRFGWVGDGVDLELRRADAPRLRALLRGQLLLVQEDARGRVLRATRLQAAAAIDDLFAGAARAPALGATVAAGRTGWRLWAPTAQRVALCLYDGPESPAQPPVALAADAASGIWSIDLPGDRSGRYYTFLVDVFAPGTGLVRNRVTDPYATSLNADSRRSYVARLDAPALQPPGWAGHARPAPLAASTDMTVYELHVRDFSIADASVPAAERGRYLAFTEGGSAGMRHLKALAAAGLSDVHLLPVFDFASVPERGCLTPTTNGSPDGEAQQAAVQAAAADDCFNWGYDPWHFGAPEGSYASDADDGAARIVEFRRMVQALHGAGLRVGMDLVYNHTFAAGQDPRSLLDRIVPGYYHRLDAAGAVERSTCCANTATEHRMMARLMVDTAVRWARDYAIDSFRFDLMGHQPRAAVEALRAAVEAATGRRVDLIGEGWNFGEVADGRRFVQASQLALNGSGIGTFNDRLRDALRGGRAGDDGADAVRHQGYVNGLFYDPNVLAAGRATPADLLQAADLVRAGLAGSLRRFELRTADGRSRPLERLAYGDQPAGYASEPSEVVNYVENHDNQTLFDADASKLPRTTSAEDRARVQLLASAFVAFGQGVAYFHAGQDLLRSKSMDRNSFDSGDAFNRIDWSLQDNGFGHGLPPAPANAESWPLMRPLLADPAMRPTPALIRWSGAAFLDLLRIRASTSLLRLRTATDVQRRLQFLNTGPDQVPTVIVERLDGRGAPGANFAEVVLLFNVDRAEHTLAVPELAGKAYALHPVQAAADAADARPQRARYEAADGRFTVPARTVVVYVLR